MYIVGGIFMKRTIFSLCLLSFSLFSCINKSENSFSNLSYDYGDVEMFKIEWKSVLKQNKEHYFAYVYSERCGHCKEIKQDVIKTALEKENIYFVEFSNEIPVLEDTLITIGKTNVDEIGIKGTPTLLEINKAILINNIAGSKAILETLTNLE